MPIVAIANYLRIAVMALISAAPLTILQEFFDGSVKKLVEDISDEEGLTLDEAKDFIVNILVDLALNAAIVGVVIKTKIAVKTSEYLGLTSKGFAKRTLTKKAEEVSVKLAASGGTKIVKSIFPKIFAIVGIPSGLIWLVNAIANTIEPGIYKPEQTNAVYRKLGIPFQYPVTESQLQPGPLDNQQFKDLAKALEAVGIKGFNNTFAQQTQIYSRQLLADLINAVYGQEILKGNAPSAKQMLPLLSPYLISIDSTGKEIIGKTIPGLTSTTLPQVKVFTGIVSQGTLGAGLTFIARPDDIIESIDELQTAAQNNLAPFLTALPSKVVYEVKIVSSVTTKDGFRQTGQAQKVVSGYATDGTPRYKTVINKFATLTIFVLTDKGTRTKLSTIILGPTDALKFQPTQNHLAMLEKNIQASVVTNNVSEIKTIQTSMPITVQAPVAPPPAIPLPPPPPPAVSVAPSPVSAPAVSAPAPSIVSTTDLATLKARLDQATNYYQTGMNPLPGTVGQGYVEMVAAQKAYDEALAKAPQPAITTTSSQDLAKQKATTLWEFYAAIGQPLPSMSTRATYYEFLGLGKAFYYTGTAEQNTKLLNKLQGK